MSTWTKNLNIIGPAGTAGAPGATGPGYVGTYSVKDYGAIGNGTTDDTAAINSAIAAAVAAPGGRVYFPPGTYGVTSVIDVPENVTLTGAHGDTILYDATSAPSPCLIQTLATHTGTAILRLRGKTESGRTYDHVGARIENLTLDGSGSPASTKGIQCVGLVREARLSYVTVRDTTDTAFWFGVGTSASPQSCRLVGCLADTAGNNGYTFTNVPDTTLIDCESLGATNSGFYFAGFMNGQVQNARSEWSGQQGILITSGYWGTGTGCGGANFLGCTTDRNGFNGLYIDTTTAGSAVLQFTNCTHRRDGRNAGTGGGNYAGIFVGTGNTMPVVIDNVQIFPGVDDDGTKTNSPQIGLSATGANAVTVNSGYIHAATTPLASGTGLVVSPAVGTATGTTGSPVRTAPSALAKSVHGGTHDSDGTDPIHFPKIYTMTMPTAYTNVTALYNAPIQVGTSLVIPDPGCPYILQFLGNIVIRTGTAANVRVDLSVRLSTITGTEMLHYTGDATRAANTYLQTQIVGAWPSSGSMTGAATVLLGAGVNPAGTGQVGGQAGFDPGNNLRVLVIPA